MTSLSPRQQETLDAIVAYQSDHAGRSPSIRDLMAFAGIRNLGNAHYLLTQLEKKGAIRRERWGARAIEVLGCRRLEGVPTEDLRAELARREAVPA